MAGFLAHLLGPFSSHVQKTAFTRWLDYNIVSSGSENEVKLRNTIKQLPEKADDFGILVKEASELVASNSDQFKIPISKNSDKDKEQGSIWLIGQWNIFQNQQSGFNSVLVESLKVLSTWTPQHLEISTPAGKTSISHYSISQKFIYDSGFGIAVYLRPLISGISINAP